jgi:hypothetical protein
MYSLVKVYFTVLVQGFDERINLDFLHLMFSQMCKFFWHCYKSLNLLKDAFSTKKAQTYTGSTLDFYQNSGLLSTYCRNSLKSALLVRLEFIWIESLDVAEI